MPDYQSDAYINSTNYQTLERHLKDLNEALEDLQNKSLASRKLRYAEVDIEAEREEGRLQPDELYVPQHLIDTNIRREQSAYIQYLTQSPRAVICEDELDLGVDMSLLEKDLSKKLRYPAWQLQMFGNVDGFQANGYSIMEVVYDKTKPGHVAHEHVEYGDFSFLSDTRDLQQVEMTMRAYYFTKTRLVEMKGVPDPETGEIPESKFDPDQVTKLIESDPTVTNTQSANDTDTQNRSLYRIKKAMFRINGIVHVAWCAPDVCDNWLRKPRPLFIGRVEMPQQPPISPMMGMLAKLKGAIMPPAQPPQPQPVYETEFPYNLSPYLISENDTISQLKGRVYLDQDQQEAITSLISSAVTGFRRSSGLYFSKDTSDPNDDVAMQKNIFLRSGSLINSKITSFQLAAPDTGIFGAINMLVTANQQETSQVNFAVNNRKDSRKTAKEISVAEQQAQTLSTVQVVLFSLSLQTLYTKMTSVIVSRVKCGLIQVPQNVRPFYDRDFVLKPSGDTDVIEKQQLIQAMMQTWPVVQQTGCATVFLTDMLEMLFPLNAPKYIQAIQQATQQQQSQQMQQMQQLMQGVELMANGIIKLSKHPDYFSETGVIHAFPIVEHYADEIEQMKKQMKQQQKTQ